MYQMNQIIDDLLNTHKSEAERIVQLAGSKLVKNAFSTAWNNLNKSGVDANASGPLIIFDYDHINSTISKWIRDFEICQEEEEGKFKEIEHLLDDEYFEHQKFRRRIEESILPEYRNLKNKMEEIDIEFANTALAFRSPLRQALNDFQLVYNEINGITGDFTGFENVSVYVHGIEDEGKSFLESAVRSSKEGDIIVYMTREGDKEYYEVKSGKEVTFVNSAPLTLEKLMQLDAFKDKTGRLHMVYEPEYENEHRQKTSDGLTEDLIEMGLLNEEINIDMFAHSYGGRRSLQFAMDYPEYVRSITTIGTPYDTNILGGLANTMTIPAEWVDKNPTEYSDYLDFNEENQRVDDLIQHSNAYTDMQSEAMAEDIKSLELANPEIHQKLLDMEITAVAGRDYKTYTVEGHGKYNGTYTIYDIDDGAVSVESQHGESLDALIDNRFSYDVEGEGIIKPAHSFEIKNEDFIELIRKVNTLYEEQD